ncbi:transketolase [Candidatus Saccharibacteria bacterium RIFCSPHIGHO2_12_FULL_49_19]|nr:MAG: transketolase [Candidatus Saccharibacteria bacterium RIFCSPHIGHO2_01_FULL_49_21]OGL37622.1 MAG: transketolase [Candidatus Saccharibacteria bacterium RIFCSPHIGHO2_12_FULL_49_19]OGL38144.1 MAG: transketolase [Candidatus Saccharibacteria bacterium RIFCSPLOWO2_01_FULL_49_22]
MHLARGELDKEDIRLGFGKGLLEAGKRHENVVALCADLTESTRMNLFADAFPERFIQVGVAEQNLVTVGSGLAAMGKIPFVSSYAAFSPGRNWEQIRTTICLNDQPVKIAGSHAGISVGADGATHQMLEDIALMRALPNMVVLAPADSVEAAKATLAMATDERPNYIRLTREATPVITTDNTPFAIGKAFIFRPGSDVTIVSTGTMTYQAMAAAQMLAKDYIRAEVIHAPTIKPLDSDMILDSAARTRLVVTAEEAQINGGLGGAVAELLSEQLPTPLVRVGVRDRFGESGKPEELLKHFGLTHNHIAMAAHHLLMNHRHQRTG